MRMYQHAKTKDDDRIDKRRQTEQTENDKGTLNNPRNIEHVKV